MAFLPESRLSALYGVDCRAFEPEAAEPESRKGHAIAGSIGHPLRKAIRNRGPIQLQYTLSIQRVGLEETSEMVKRFDLRPGKMIVSHPDFVAVDVGVFVFRRQAIGDGPGTQLSPDKRGRSCELNPIRFECDGKSDGLENGVNGVSGQSDNE